MSRDRSGDAPKTANELVGELDRDAGYRARAAAKEQERLAHVANNRIAAAPIVADLVAAGFPVTSIGELVIKKLNFRIAIPILLSWLPKVSNQDVRESIVRALSVPFARPLAARPLVEEFRRPEKETGPGLRWAIGSALEVVAGDEVLSEMLELATDHRYGKAREMVVAGLGNMTASRVIPTLVDLLRDDQLVAHALIALGKLRSPNTRPEIEPLLAHPKAHVRREAKRAIQKIDKVAR